MGQMPVTLLGLLNAINGVGAQEGRLLFMTTNYPGRLDEALIRPGQIDVKYHLGKASREAAGQMFDHFFGTESLAASGNHIDSEVVDEARASFLSKVEPDTHSFATLQGVFMKTRDDVLAVASKMEQLLDSVGSRVPEKQSGWDTLAVMERAAKTALEKESKEDEAQRTLGSGPVIKRLTGSPSDVSKDDKKQEMIFLTFFTTYGVPELLAKSGIIYCEIKILHLAGIPQFGFAKKDALGDNKEASPCSVDDVTADGCDDFDGSWAIDGQRGLRFKHGESIMWNCAWEAGMVVGLAANIDKGMVAISKNGTWSNEDEELGIVFKDELIKEGVYPCFTASYLRINCKHSFDKTNMTPHPPTTTPTINLGAGASAERNLVLKI
jgi:SpoVK/Ycf46/Vps4 family AAA+-type ATPase